MGRGEGFRIAEDFMISGLSAIIKVSQTAHFYGNLVESFSFNQNSYVYGSFCKESSQCYNLLKCSPFMRKALIKTDHDFVTSRGPRQFTLRTLLGRLVTD